MSRHGPIAFVLWALLPLVAAAQGTVRTRAPAVDVIEQLGDRVPEDGRLIDSEGQPFRLADELHRGKPVILALVYYRCPQLCNLTLSALTRSLRDSGMKPGQDYRAVIVSIDPTETARDAAESKRGHMQALGVSPSTSDWRFATAAEPEIQALARATGFKYRYDAPSKQFEHVSVAFVLSEEGRLSRYLYGIETRGRDMADVGTRFTLSNSRIPPLPKIDQTLMPSGMPPGMGQVPQGHSDAPGRTAGKAGEQ